MSVLRLEIESVSPLPLALSLSKGFLASEDSGLRQAQPERGSGIAQRDLMAAAGDEL
jgi:hypothetical protein